MTEYELIGGHAVPVKMAEFYDRMAWITRACPPPDYETRTRMATERRAAEAEDAIVRALVEVAERQTDNIERAAVLAVEHRGDNEANEVDEAGKIAADHMFSSDRLIAMKSLAASRGADLADVLRAALRGDLRDIVRLPAVTPTAPSTENDTSQETQ